MPGLTRFRRIPVRHGRRRLPDEPFAHASLWLDHVAMQEDVDL